MALSLVTVSLPGDTATGAWEKGLKFCGFHPPYPVDARSTTQASWLLGSMVSEWKFNVFRPVCPKNANFLGGNLVKLEIGPLEKILRGVEKEEVGRNWGAVGSDQKKNWGPKKGDL